MSRCLETAKLSFPHSYESLEVSFIADESWRETVNYLCDSRRRTSVLKGEYPRVDFDFLDHDEYVSSSTRVSLAHCASNFCIIETTQ